MQVSELSCLITDNDACLLRAKKQLLGVDQEIRAIFMAFSQPETIFTKASTRFGLTLSCTFCGQDLLHIVTAAAKQHTKFSA